MLLIFLSNLNMGGGGPEAVTTVFPDPFAATATEDNDPFAATYSGGLDPFVATATLKGS